LCCKNSAKGPIPNALGLLYFLIYGTIHVKHSNNYITDFIHGLFPVFAHFHSMVRLCTFVRFLEPVYKLRGPMGISDFISTVKVYLQADSSFIGALARRRLPG
jgi:hypothetical protein